MVPRILLTKEMYIAEKLFFADWCPSTHCFGFDNFIPELRLVESLAAEIEGVGRSAE